MTDAQIKAACEDVARRYNVKFCEFDPALGVVAPRYKHSKVAALLAESKGLQIWTKSRGVWVRPCEKTRVVDPTDSQMLEWMCRDGRHISHDREGERCNVWCDNPNEESRYRTVPVEGYPQKSYPTPRLAIIAAMKVQP